jgi:hypothetical protein
VTNATRGRFTSGTPHRIAGGIVQRWPAAALFLALLGCTRDGDPIAPGPPPPPGATLDGTWRFRIVVVSAEPPCLYWLGRTYTPVIEISQAGSAVIAEGFMDLGQNELAGTINSSLRVQLSGHYPEEGFITKVNLAMTWDGGEALTGTGTWEWSGLEGRCKRGDLSVNATRAE